MNNSFLMTNSLVLGIMQFCARVAERQTRRSQKPLSKDVRVQIPPRAPLHMIKACFQQAFFVFRTSLMHQFVIQANVPRGNLADRAVLEPRKTIMRLDLQLFAIRDYRGSPNNRFRPKNAANRLRNGPFPLCTDRRESLIAKKLQKWWDFCFSVDRLPQ